MPRKPHGQDQPSLAQEPQNQPPVTLHQPLDGPSIQKEPDRVWRPGGEPKGPTPDPVRAWTPEGKTPSVEFGHGTLPEDVAKDVDPEPQDMTPDKLRAIAEANAAAEKAIDAEMAAQEAADQAAELAEDAEDVGQPHVRRCPRCRERMTKHDNPTDPHKYGAWHCNNCGVCWRGNKLRTGELTPAGF